MAIINSVAFGKARKTAGNVVFYDRLGQTVARQKNLTPTNPNTYAQVARRILITNPSRVYRVMVEVTRLLYGNKFFDYSFGRSYLATKRRTSYNEFFFRAMQRPFPVFLSKDEVIARTCAFIDTYELSQGSLQAPLMSFDVATVFKTNVAGVVVGDTIPQALVKFAAQYGYTGITSFKSLVFAFYYVNDVNMRKVLKARVATINSNDLGVLSFDALDSGIIPIPITDGLSFACDAFVGGATGGFLAGYAIVPFAMVDGLLTSANVSVSMDDTAPGYADLLDHTVSEVDKQAAILSYSPSTPSGSI